MYIKALCIGFILLTLCVSSSLGQQLELTDEEWNNSIPIQMIFADTVTSEVVDGWFRSDSTKGTIFLMLQGGSAPVIYESDAVFENKYKIYYYDFGCIAPEYQHINAYHSRVFNYLTKRYGKKWKRQIRKDVIGFKEWKRKPDDYTLKQAL